MVHKNIHQSYEIRTLKTTTVSHVQQNKITLPPSVWDKLMTPNDLENTARSKISKWLQFRMIWKYIILVYK